MQAEQADVRCQLRAIKRSLERRSGGERAANGDEPAHIKDARLEQAALALAEAGAVIETERGRRQAAEKRMLEAEGNAAASLAALHDVQQTADVLIDATEMSLRIGASANDG